MYNIIKQNILNGNFKLSDVQYKIKKLWSMGDFDEAQLNELMSLAMDKATPAGERPKQDEMLKTIYNMYIDLESRVKLLENNGIVEGEPSDDNEIIDEIIYEEWKPWDGLSNNYQIGKIVSHKDELWKSTYSGQNVWEPGVPGIDERYWIKYNPNAEIIEPETEPEIEDVEAEAAE